MIDYSAFLPSPEETQAVWNRFVESLKANAPNVSYNIMFGYEEVSVLQWLLIQLIILRCTEQGRQLPILTLKQ